MTEFEPFKSSDEFTMDNFNAKLGAVLPSGCILLWSGAADAIPTGFALCNGEKGTPDLRGRFVVGAGGAMTTL